MKETTRKSGILARLWGRLRYLLRNAAQFNLIKAARRIRGRTRVHSFVRSAWRRSISRNFLRCCYSVSRAARMHDMQRESGAVSCHARVSCFRVPHFRSPARRRTYFPTRPLRDRIYLQNVSGAHLTPHRTAPHRSGPIYAVGNCARDISSLTKTSQRLPFDATSPPVRAGKIFFREIYKKKTWRFPRLFSSGIIAFDSACVRATEGFMKEAKYRFSR